MYGDVKSGGSRFETVVRKVDGNVEVRLGRAVGLHESQADLSSCAALQNLRRDLLEYLHDVPSFTKPQSRQVILRGDWTKEVKEWLAARGF